MKLVLFGRDVQLAKVEFFRYTKKIQANFKLEYEEDNYWILNFDSESTLDFQSMINHLGGVLRIIDIKQTLGTIHNLDLDTWDLYLPKKYNYSISIVHLNEEELNTVQDHAKAFVKNTKSKAVYKNPKMNGAIRIIDPSSYFSWDLESGVEYFYVKASNNKIYCGVSLGCGSTKVFKMLDTNLPARKFTHGTSFRAAKMQMNNLNLEEDKTIVDPFCGTGTFLIEGLIQGYNVIGIDNDQDLINDSKLNLHWLKQELDINNTSEVVFGDSRTTEFSADACVFEPYMGPFLKKIPSEKEAEHIWEELDELYRNTFKNLSNNLSEHAQIVCILPDIPTTSQKIFTLNESVFEDNGFAYIAMPAMLKTKAKIKYDTPDGAKIIRHIYVLEKI